MGPLAERSVSTQCFCYSYTNYFPERARWPQVMAPGCRAFQGVPCCSPSSLRLADPRTLGLSHS